jgi:hypothetical protein
LVHLDKQAHLVLPDLLVHLEMLEIKDGKEKLDLLDLLVQLVKEDNPAILVLLVEKAHLDQQAHRELVAKLDSLGI